MSDSRGGCQLAAVPPTLTVAQATGRGFTGLTHPLAERRWEVLAPGGARKYWRREAPGLHAAQAAAGEYTADTRPPGWPALSSRSPRRVTPPDRGAQRSLQRVPSLWARRGSRCRGCPVAGGARGLSAFPGPLFPGPLF